MSIIRRSNIFDPFSLDLFDPLEGFSFPLLGGTLSRPSGSAVGTSAFVGARIDWKETPEAHLFKADLLGVNKEEVKVEVEDGHVLKISGERKRDKEEKTDTWHHIERNKGQFLHRFHLPENAKLDQVKAAIENGVITITVPKEELKKPHP